MANPNTAARYVAKNPWDFVSQHRDARAAYVAADDHQAANPGKSVRVTSVKMGPTKKPWREFRVWSR